MDYKLKKKGFTLVEILVVLAIIAGLLVLSVSSYSVARKKIQLDVATSDIESFIAEARDRARSGFYDDSGNPEEAQSLCFGVKVKVDESVEMLQTTYNRLALDSKCVLQDVKTIKQTEQNDGISVKEIHQFDVDAPDEFYFFFRPPYAEIEIADLSFAQDPHLKIVIGYTNSDEPNDHRVVIFNALTGNTTIDRYTQ